MTETQKIVQRWLSRGIWQMQEIEQLKEQRKEEYAKLTKITQNLSGEVVSSTKDPHKYDVIASFDVDIEEKRRTLDKTLCEIREAISTLSDSRYRTAMTWHFVNGYDWETSADKMGYEVTQMYRFQSKSLDELDWLISERKDAI